MARSGWSLKEIAEHEGISVTGVRKWFSRRGLTYWHHKPAQFNTSDRGYERWQHKYDYKSYYCYVHRLLAISEYGVDAVKGKHIHHKNGIPWDNRPDNIIPLDPGEHSKTDNTVSNVPHWTERTRATTGEFVSELD